MRARILRIELRRSNARWLVLVPLLPILFAAGDAGRGLTGLAFDQRQLLQYLVAPLVLGIAAWQARRDRRSRTDELLTTTSRPRWQRALPTAAALAVGAIAGLLAGLAVMVGLVVAAGGYLSPVGLPIVAVGALALLVHVALGLVLGRWLPFPLVLPVLIVYFMVSLVLADTEGYTDPPGSLLLWGSLEAHSTMSQEFAAVATGTHLAQAVWAVALAAAALILFTSTRLRVGAAAIVPVVLGAAVAVPLLPDRYADAFHIDPGATDLVCTQDAPRVCVMRAHQVALAELSGPAREALATLAANVPDPPTSVVEVPFSVAAPPAPRADAITVPLVVSGNGEIQPASGMTPDLRWELLLGAGTPGCANAPELDTPERRRYDIARLVAAAWLLDQEPPPPAFPDDPFLLQQSETVPVYQALRELPADEQQARVAELREAELACDGRDRLALLAGP